MNTVSGIPSFSHPGAIRPGSASGSGMLDFLQSSGAIPLKQKWSISIPEEIRKVFPRKEGGVFLLLPDRVMGINLDGKKDCDLRINTPLSVSEGKENIFVVGREEYEPGCMYVATRVRYKIAAFRKNQEPGWEYLFPKVKQESGDEPAPPAEDCTGKIWLKVGGHFYRYSPSDKKMEVIDEKYVYPHPIFPDQKGFAYTFWGDMMRYSPDLSLKTISGHPNHFFMIGDQPYAVFFAPHKLVKLDFDHESQRQILQWKDDKNPLKPFVDANGIIHLLFRSFGENARKALYVKLTPDGKVTGRKELRLSSEDLPPVVTPRGTLYFMGRKEKNDRDFPLYAVDERNQVHQASLPEEPVGIFPGKGEGIVVVLKGGKIFSFEAQSLQTLRLDQKAREQDEDTLKSLQSSWGKHSRFA